MHFGGVQVKIARAYLEGWVGVTIRIITDFSWVGQSSKITPVAEKGGNASTEVDSKPLMFTSCSKSSPFDCRGSQERIVFLCFLVCFSAPPVCFVPALFESVSYSSLQIRNALSL